jgi:hypothetical protein
MKYFEIVVRNTGCILLVKSKGVATMKSQLFWLMPNHVLYWKLAGNVPAEELCAMTRFISEQIAQTKGSRVHIILDGNGIQELDHLSGEARTAFQTLAKNTRVGRFLAVVSNLKTQIQFSGLSRPFGLNWRNTTSFADAIHQLKNYDSSLRTIPTQPPTETPLQRAV